MAGQVRKRKSRAKQSPTDRMERLENFRCPIHNMPFGQAPPYDEDEEGTQCFFAKCIRKDCQVGVFCYDPMGAGPWVLPANLSYLIAPDFANANEAVQIEPSASNRHEHAELKSRFAAFDLFEKGDPKSFSRC